MAISVDPSTPRPQRVHQCEILQMMTCMCANIAVFGGESYGHAQLEIECLKGSFL